MSAAGRRRLRAAVAAAYQIGGVDALEPFARPNGRRLVCPACDGRGVQSGIMLHPRDRAEACDVVCRLCLGWGRLTVVLGPGTWWLKPRRTGDSPVVRRADAVGRVRALAGPPGEKAPADPAGWARHFQPMAAAGVGPGRRR